MGGAFIGPVAVYVSEFYAICGVSFADKRSPSSIEARPVWLFSRAWAATLNFAPGYHRMV